MLRPHSLKPRHAGCGPMLLCTGPSLLWLLHKPGWPCSCRTVYATLYSWSGVLPWQDGVGEVTLQEPSGTQGRVHQDKLQGKYDSRVEFATTPGGTCAFRKYLFAIPIAVTVNYSTANLHYLDSHDWLGHEGNRVLVNFPEVLSDG